MCGFLMFVNCFDVDAYDIKPESKDIVQADFLTLDLVDKYQDRPLYFIGNPPFGRASKLATAFIRNIVQNK